MNTDTSPSSSGVIKAIDGTSVHRICSGQVILNLATAVKELIENSVDAGATNVEVKLKEYGSEVIEVVDNGCGVEECNFQGLTLKHHTSKLREFSDLVSVDTFGFRGEALSSLCAVSDVSIVTCHIRAKNATKLEFDHGGKITMKGPCARQQGTTVTVQNLFSTLPVRYKEFQRNLKKEFTKMVQVLTAYCLISCGVRITCTNQVGKGKKTTIASVNGNKHVKENITNIFGPKQQTSIIEFNQYKPTEDVCSDLGVKLSADQQLSCPFELNGFVSSCQHGKGRSSTDRQFIYVNSRPCDLTKVSRIINEVYHMYNRHQYPCVVLNISLSKESVDVNVTPDKRQVFLENEKLLLAVIKSSLIRMFEPISSTYEVNQGKGSLGLQHDALAKFRRMSDSAIPSQNVDPSSGKPRSSLSSSLAGLKRSFSSAFVRDRDDVDRKAEELRNKQPKLDSFFTPVQTTKTDQELPDSTQSSQSTTADDSGCESLPSKSFGLKIEYHDLNMAKDSPLGSPKIEYHDPNIVKDFALGSPKIEYRDLNVSKDSRLGSPDIDSSSGISSCDNSGNLRLGSFKFTDINSDVHVSCQEGASEAAPVNLEHIPSDGGPNELKVTDDEKCSSEQVNSDVDSLERLSAERIEEEKDDKSLNNRTFDKEEVSPCPSSTPFSQSNTQSMSSSQKSSSSKSSAGSLSLEDTSRPIIDKGQMSAEEDNNCKITFTEFDKKEKVTRKTVEVPFSMDSLKRKMIIKKLQGAEDKPDLMYRNFRATIQPDSNNQAEEELQKEISKDMFAKMEILGQFNLGFILAKLGQDLFIIDQHATDEKFNFETLQQTTVLEGQKMIQPLKLELTAVNESVIMDNLAIFKKNGFDFNIDEEAPPTEKISLVASPVSKNWQFGKPDIEEMVFMLSDSPGVMCRPSRVRQMFASRSCRKSIMIGTALNKSQMKKLVCHMGEIDQPWNCPHGRPTMRHLINLNMLPDQNT